MCAATASWTVVACAPLARSETRPAKSSVGCMRAAIEHLNLNGFSDEQKHCIAAGAIARRCSITEAMLASVGKEIEDAFGAGDAEWRDLKADRQGLRCARTASDEAALSACCVRTEPD